MKTKKNLASEDQLRLKVKRARAKVSMIKGTGCSILASLKKLNEVVEEQNLSTRFIPCTKCRDHDLQELT